MIKRIRIQNFKSIRDIEVCLGPLTVLVGRSGTGKSNFVNAIRFIRDYLAWGDGAVRGHDAWKYILPAGRGEAPGFSLDFVVPGHDEEFTYSFALVNKAERGGVQLKSESLTVGSSDVFVQSDNRWIRPPQTAPIPQLGQLALGSLSAIPEARIAFTALTNGIGCYEFSSEVAGTDIGNIHQSPQAKMAQQSGVQQFPANGSLLDDAANYVPAATSIIGNLSNLGLKKTLVASLQILNPSIASLELDSVQNPKRITVTHKFPDQSLSLDLAQESDGFRRFFAHLLALYQQPSKLTLLFEEPEAGIHPGALGLLADEFRQAPVKGRGQVVLTTHSPELLNHLEVDCLRVVTIHNHETRIGSVAHEQVESVKERLLTPGELLTVDYARVGESEATAP
ncbi:MAG: AAA family ATPase [Pirellulaceae bacterium]|nr:AAA family ATPase [Pirellulaceae bacterium]